MFSHNHSLLVNIKSKNTKMIFFFTFFSLNLKEKRKRWGKLLLRKKFMCALLLHSFFLLSLSFLLVLFPYGFSQTFAMRRRKKRKFSSIERKKEKKVHDETMKHFYWYYEVLVACLLAHEWRWLKCEISGGLWKRINILFCFRLKFMRGYISGVGTENNFHPLKENSFFSLPKIIKAKLLSKVSKGKISFTYIMNACALSEWDETWEEKFLIQNNAWWRFRCYR